MIPVKDFYKVVKYPKISALTAYGILRTRFLGDNGGTAVMEEDWDVLVILDACRYDLFRELNTMQGELEKVRSLGSMTGEFMEQNFGGETFSDTVYISANPNPEEQDATFAHVESLFETQWDDDLRTVPPDKVTDRAIALSEDYPNKRLIIHYLQPHYPFLGEVGKEFHEKHGYTSQSDNWNVWTKLRAGEHDEAEVREAYKENLRVALPEVERLVNNIQGKIVISSDHGNAFGEYGVYGHPRYVHIPALTDVPWFIPPYGYRRKIKSSETTETFEGAANDDVKEKLRDLGYVE